MQNLQFIKSWLSASLFSRPLALTCAWSSSNSYASQCTKSFTVWPPKKSRHKLIANNLFMREILATFCDLRGLAKFRIRLVTHR